MSAPALAIDGLTVRYGPVAAVRDVSLDIDVGEIVGLIGPNGAGVLLIDHNMALIMDICDRIQVLDQGRTLAEGTPDEIRANLDVAAAYLGESAVHETGDGT